MTTEHHMNEEEQDRTLTVMSWAGGVVIVIAVLAFFHFGM
jgi:hypothetical protein